jgi:hypothetical protein
MSGKKETLHNFKSCDEFATWLSRAVLNLDRSKSDVIRCCILLALPTVCTNPSLIDHVRLEDINKQVACQSYQSFTDQDGR